MILAKGEGKMPKLSMWMIANRLEALEPEVQIGDSGSAMLYSARQVYATNCVHVYQDGADAVCAGEEGAVIRLKNMDKKMAFELIQSVFDFYGHWTEEIRQALFEEDYDRLIDKCWMVFHNPIVLQDTNRKVIALSSQYGRDDLDDEWRHMCDFGFSSVNAIKYFKNHYTPVHNVNIYEPRIFRFPSTDLGTTHLFTSIFYKGILYGKISIYEKEHKINQGDVELLKYVVSLLGPFLEKRALAEKRTFTERSVFLDMLLENPVEPKSLERQLQYMSWDEEDVFRVAVFEFQDEEKAEEQLLFMMLLIDHNLRKSAVITNKHHIIAIFNEKAFSEPHVHTVMEMLVRENGLRAGTSFGGWGIRSLPFLYRQSIFALRFGKKYDPQKEIVRFYDYAFDFLLGGTVMLKMTEINERDIIYSCHPDILRFWNQDCRSDGYRIKTLQAYLRNNRSLVNTAQELYIHRSTLVYRIKKIQEEMQCDIAERYSWDYIEISIRLLIRYGEEMEKPEETFI